MAHLVLILSNSDPDQSRYKSVEVRVSADGISAYSVEPGAVASASGDGPMHGPRQFLLISSECGSWSELPDRNSWWEIDRKLVDPSGAGLTGGLGNSTATLPEPEYGKARASQINPVQAY